MKKWKNSAIIENFFNLQEEKNNNSDFVSTKCVNLNNHRLSRYSNLFKSHKKVVATKQVGEVDSYLI